MLNSERLMEQEDCRRGDIHTYPEVKSRPREKLPAQSRSTHRLATAPSPPPAPLLQLMAAAPLHYRRPSPTLS